MAGKEKAYVFIIVNRFDQIKKVDKCRTEILSQIQKISPATHRNSSQLVHFISAKECLSSIKNDLEESQYMKDFIYLEECLGNFILGMFLNNNY